VLQQARCLVGKGKGGGEEYCAEEEEEKMIVLVNIQEKEKVIKGESALRLLHYKEFLRRMSFSNIEDEHIKCLRNVRERSPATALRVPECSTRLLC